MLAGSRGHVAGRRREWARRKRLAAVEVRRGAARSAWTEGHARWVALERRSLESGRISTVEVRRHAMGVVGRLELVEMRRVLREAGRFLVSRLRLRGRWVLRSLRRTSRLGR